MSQIDERLNGKEILGIDLLRFLAAFMVLCFHLCFWSFRAEDRPMFRMLGSTLIPDSIASISKSGWVGVEIFFVISGFIIAYSAEKSTAFSFFRGRFIRLMPCVWICCLASVPAAYLVKEQAPSTIIRLLLKSLVLYPVGPWIQGVLWTLVVEIAFYFVIFVLVCRNWFRHIEKVAAVIGAYSAAFWIARGVMLQTRAFHDRAVILGDMSWWPYLQLSLIHYGCFFSLGVTLWLALIKRKMGWLAASSPMLLIGCLFEISYLNSTKIHDTGIAQSAWVPMALWIVSLIFILLSVIYNARLQAYLRGIGPSAPDGLKWLGRMTYPLYLLHLPAALLVVYIMPESVGQYPRWGLGVLTAILASSLVTSYVEPLLKVWTRSALDHVYEAARRLMNLVPGL